MVSTNYYNFDEDQKQEIQVGINAGLDVFIYAKPEFMAIQMRQIRLGLEAGIDAEVYSNPEYDWFQMEEIRKGMEAGIQYELYARTDIDYQRMRQVRKGLKDGIDLSKFVKLPPGILEELREAVLAKVSIIDFIKEGYGKEQLAEIRKALEKGVNIKPFINVEQIGPSIRQIRLGLEEGLDVSVYADIEYSWQQMSEIRKGMENRLDVQCFSNNLYSWQQMREIRLGLEEGLDVTEYSSFVYTANDMERIRTKMLKDRVDTIVDGAINKIDDEQIVVFISNNEMEACIEIRCDEKVAVKAKDITSKLAARGICKGILHEEIKAIADEKKYGKTIVVASGKPAKRGEDGWYEFFFNTKPKKTPKILPDGTADFKDIEWFEIVSKGQKIAYYHEAGSGEAGYTVTGKTIRPVKGKEKKILAGKGFELLDDKKTYISALDGKVDLIGETKLEVTRACVIEEVNHATGNINFDGSVYVKGNVGSNAMIIATENVVVNGFVDSCTIRCGGEICLRNGVNGGGVGFIEAKSNVMAQFFEGVRVVSGGNISAHYAMNCEMYAKGKITFYGEKGLLIGGYARAALGIEAYNVGNKVGIRTVLNVGLDDRLLNTAEQIELKIESVKRELLILKNSYEDFKKKYPAEIRNTMEIFLKIENAIYTKALEHKELIEKKDLLEAEMSEMKDAKVIVNGSMFEGVQVIVDNIKWNSFSVKDVTIRCSKKKILVESN